MLAAKFFRSLFTKEATPRRSQTVRLGLDNLERRDVPSGTVTGALSRNGKTWTITGDDAGNEITINPTGNGSFTLTGTDTTVSGDIDVSGVENITIKMNDGDDWVTINTTNANNTLAGHLKIDGGNGTNGVYVADMTISKNLMIKNGTNASGQDQNSIEDTSVTGKVEITNGNGDTWTYVYGSTINGALRITNGSGYDYQRIVDTNINSNVLLRNGDGNTYTEFMAIGMWVSTINGDLRIINGSGYDENLVLDINVKGNVLVRNGMPNGANEAGSTGIGSARNTGQLSIDGNITVSYDGGVNYGDGLANCDVQGNVAFNYNRSSGYVTFGGMDEPQKIHGNLSIKGTGGIVVDTHLVGFAQGLWVGGKLTINSGAANDNLRLDKLTVMGKTTIKTGDGSDTVTIDDSMFAAFNLNTSKGNDTVNVDAEGATSNVTTFTGKVKVNLGMGDDQMSLGTSGDDTAMVAFGDVTQISGDTGNDTINENNFVALNSDPITILA